MVDVSKPSLSKPITAEELRSGASKTYLKLLVNGGFGVGKTYFSMTFPKWAYAMIEPAGIKTAETNPALLDNMVYYESFAPTVEEDIKVTFQRLDEFLVKVREDVKAGKVETLIIDNLTHLSEARWLYIDKHEKSFGKSGNPDTMAMYGALSRYLAGFILLKVVTMPSHVVVNCHVMDEEEEGIDGKRTKTGGIITNTLGGFRKDAAGYFNASLFLDVKKDGGVYKHRAQCRPGSGKPAKNNLGLPEFVEDLSYTKILAALPKRPA